MKKFILGLLAIIITIIILIKWPIAFFVYTIAIFALNGISNIKKNIFAVIADAIVIVLLIRLIILIA